MSGQASRGEWDSNPHPRRHAILQELAHHVAGGAGRDLTATLRLVTEAMSEALGVESCAVWRCAPGVLVCLDQFDRSVAAHAAGEVLDRRALPVYLAAAAAARIIPVDDAASDARVAELHDVHLAPRGVTSVLDAPVRLGGELVAFVCCDHVGPPRRWSDDEQTFAASVADLVALVLEGQRRREAEAALEKQRAFLRQVIDADPTLIFVRDAEGRFTLVNQAAAAVYGTTVDELVGKFDGDFNRDPAQVAAFLAVDREVLATGRERIIAEEVVTDAAGRPRTLSTIKRPLLDAAGRPAQVLGVAVDITERKRAEEERARLEQSLQKAQRLESIGLLAGGLAHDFNNLLTPILALAQHLEGALASDPELAGDARDISAAAVQARDITAQLMALGRRQLLQVRAVDLNEEVSAATKILARLLPESVSIVLSLAREPVLALVDPAQLRQVLLNLAVNARDAMPGGGELTIGTAPAGDRVRLSVTDSGVGIAPDVLPNIFDPFFTTKEIGRGSGLGLATVYGIVQQHGGTVEVDSAVGRGAHFVVTLPRAERPRPAAPAPVAAPRGGRETVLVAEDEELVRRLVVRVLRQAGFTVLTAPTPVAVLELAAAHDGPIDLLLVDVVMPGMDGVALAKRVLAGRGGSKVLYMSGHVHDILGQHGIVDERTPILRKPFVPGDLLAAVRQVLDA